MFTSKHSTASAPAGRAVRPFPLGCLGLVGSVALASCQANRIGVIELSGADAGAVADAEPAGDDAAGPFVVDDFEDLDLVPYDARFAPWQDYSFNQPVSLATWMDIGAALNSNGGLNLEWAAQDPPDGMANVGGVGIRTLVSNEQVFIDLSAYSRVVLSHRYEGNVDDRVEDLGPGCGSQAQFQLLLGCSEYGTEFLIPIPTSTTYSSAVLPLDSFRERGWDPTFASLGECLSRVDSFNFQATSQIGDGQCGRGHLFIDGISIR